MERYLRGEYAEVWSELARLPENTFASQAVVSDCEAVAQETMTRVRRNCEELARRLGVQGYTFSDPELTESRAGTWIRGHIVTPGTTVPVAIAEIERLAGAVPLSLRSFWQQVGAVAFVGRWSSTSVGNDTADPLWVYGPDATLVDLHDFEDNDDWDAAACIAPDYLHKGDISGGAPYRVRLGRYCADARIIGTPYERDPTVTFGQEPLLFVSYLRAAILQWGGFPGFQRSPDLLPSDVRLQLTTGLVPF
jgi:hypothetical protein